MLKTTLRQLIAALAVTVLATLGVIASNESGQGGVVVANDLQRDSQWG
ncbi:hypothetical protein [Streptomyces sp. NPDC051546]